jgi:hypothetical protein
VAHGSAYAAAVLGHRRLARAPLSLALRRDRPGCSSLPTRGLEARHIILFEIRARALAAGLARHAAVASSSIGSSAVRGGQPMVGCRGSFCADPGSPRRLWKLDYLHCTSDERLCGRRAAGGSGLAPVGGVVEHAADARRVL